MPKRYRLKVKFGDHSIGTIFVRNSRENSSYDAVGDLYREEHCGYNYLHAISARYVEQEPSIFEEVVEEPSIFEEVVEEPRPTLLVALLSPGQKTVTADITEDEANEIKRLLKL